MAADAIHPDREYSAARLAKIVGVHKQTMAKRLREIPSTRITEGGQFRCPGRAYIRWQEEHGHV